MTEESKAYKEVSPNEINAWIADYQENNNNDAQEKLVLHYQKLIE